MVCVEGVCIDSVTGETIEGEMNDRIDSTLVESWGESIRSEVVRGEAARQSPSNSSFAEEESVVPFVNIAEQVLGFDWKLWNDRPGVVVFDFDRDDDLGGTRPFAAQYLPAEHPHPFPEQRLPAEPVVLPGIEPFRPASD